MSRITFLDIDFFIIGNFKIESMLETCYVRSTIASEFQ